MMVHGGPEDRTERGFGLLEPVLDLSDTCGYNPFATLLSFHLERQPK